MNAAHFHLIINHFPVLVTAATIFVLLIGILKKSDDVKKVSIPLLILTALITIPVYLSGDKAQEMIEGNYDDVDETYIELHEDFALYSFVAMDIAGAIALIFMFLYRKPKLLPNSAAFFILAVLIAVFAMMSYTANLGGKIHHPEVRKDKLPWESSSPQKNTDNNSGNEKKEKSGKVDKEKDDDDE